MLILKYTWYVHITSWLHSLTPNFRDFYPTATAAAEKWGQWSRREGTFLEWHIRVHKFNIMFVMLLDLTRSQSHHRQQGLRLLSRVSNFSVRNVPHWSTFAKPPVVFTHFLAFRHRRCCQIGVGVVVKMTGCLAIWRDSYSQIFCIKPLRRNELKLHCTYA